MGKSRILLFFTVFIVLVARSFAADTAPDASSETFKYFMHRIYDSYSNARVSITLNNREIADIYLKQMQEAVLMAQSRVPERKKDGTPMDKKTFIERITRMQSMVSDLRAAVKYDEPTMTKTLPEEIFQVCVACHSEARLGYLFRTTRVSSLFADYMHRVSDSLDLARIYHEEKARPGEVDDQVKLMNYYLDLLKGSFPEEGPSGVVLDREGFNRRVEAMREAGRAAAAALAEKKQVDFESLRQSLNGLCVACHEPERIK